MIKGIYVYPVDPFTDLTILLSSTNPHGSSQLHHWFIMSKNMLVAPCWLLCWWVNRFLLHFGQCFQQWWKGWVKHQPFVIVCLGFICWCSYLGIHCWGWESWYWRNNNELFREGIQVVVFNICEWNSGWPSFL